MTTLQFRPFAAAAALAICGIALIGCTTSGPQDHASTASSHASVDAQIDATLSKLYSTVPGAREMVDTSKGMLIFPSVVGGSFVIGAEYGRGALQINGQTQRYYSIAGGSLGPQFGAQSKAIIYLFNTQQALEKFLASQGWTVGLDATVALASIKSSWLARDGPWAWMPPWLWPASAPTVTSIPPPCARRWWASCWQTLGWNLVHRSRA